MLLFTRKMHNTAIISSIGTITIVFSKPKTAVDIEIEAAPTKIVIFIQMSFDLG